MLVQLDQVVVWKLVLSTGDAPHHVGAGCKTSMTFNMLRDANEEGHSTGWLDLAFTT